MGMNENILKLLREASLSEAKPVGMIQTDKVKADSKAENNKYYNDTKKKMSDYEKVSTSAIDDSIEEPKFNYEGDSEKEYHDDMEIRNGMEMLNYDRKPSERFTQRAKEAIEGSSNMGNNPEWANVYPEQKGFTGPDFGKNLVKTIERSKKKRDAATPTLDQFGDDIEEKNVGVNKTKSAYKPAVSKKPVAIGESVIKESKYTVKYWMRLKDDEKEEFSTTINAESDEDAMAKFKDSPRGKQAIKSSITVSKSADVSESEKPPVKPRIRQQDNPKDDEVRKYVQDPNQRPVHPPKVRQQDNPIRESEVDPNNTHFLVDKSSGKIMFAWDYTGVEPDEIKQYVKIDVKDMFSDRKASEFKVVSKGGLQKQGIDPMDSSNWVQVSESNNKEDNKQLTESKMKRLKFKNKFNGVDTALKVIPESYKVDNKVFEMTDGSEHYKVRWEGNLTEGKAIVLSSFHQEALNEDIAKIKHLMGFKSQDTMGNLKGSQRLTEDKTFFDMLKKSKSLTEAEAKPDFLDVDKDGDKKEPMKKAAKEADHGKAIEEGDMIDEEVEKEGEE